ncbi:MAG TPA: lipid-A-disaccharide synthase [Oleiagrimonas sp.]|nr:lipid-A-disaccharide synthase [Oleiagrimonas sp.]
MPSPDKQPVIALLAGEASGDQLGANLISALRERFPDARFVGVGGPRMQAEGIEAWHDTDALSVMGFAEVLRHLPRLLKLRRDLARRLLALRPDVFIGIDAPDFNLGLERKLTQAGIPTVHYVSPSVWAWRENRVDKIGRSADRILCLFPMEPAIYEHHGIDARFVGHPLAASWPILADRAAARDALDLPQDRPVLAVLPGSRPSEIERLGHTFVEAADRVAQRIPGLRIVIPAANERCRALLQTLTAKSEVLLLAGQAREAMLAADVILLASGTATLEAMLAKRPMVVGYRVAPTSYWIARALRMLKTDIYSLPNILTRADDPQAPLPVPELMQEACTANHLADAILDLFGDTERRGNITATFERLHHKLRGEAPAGHPAAPAAEAVAELIRSR